MMPKKLRGQPLLIGQVWKGVTAYYLVTHYKRGETWGLCIGPTVHPRNDNDETGVICKLSFDKYIFSQSNWVLVSKLTE